MNASDQSASLAVQIELLVRFDDLQGWEAFGFKHCVACMNSELGNSDSLGWEYLRVGRELRKLRTLTALLRSGNLTWSKVRLISRVADNQSELLLYHAALDASVSNVARICSDFRWDKKSVEDSERRENERALQQFLARSFTWRKASNSIPNTDRYLVVINTNVEGVVRQSKVTNPASPSNQTQASGSVKHKIFSVKPCIPDARPIIQGTRPIAHETV